MIEYSMNRFRHAHRFVLLTLCCIGLGTSLAQSDTLYKQDFQSTSLGETPEDFLNLSGKFAVEKNASNHYLNLPGAPLDSHGAIFGPDNEGDLVLSARVRSKRKGRLYPSFGIGLYGLGGNILKVSPAKKSLELFRGREGVKEVPYDWKSNQWTSLKLEVVANGESSWMIRGKAWADDTPEPAGWQLTAQTELAPTQGKASLWGQPYAGNPIQYDELTLNRPSASTGDNPDSFQLGIQTWTFRNLDFDQVLAFAKEH